MNPFVEDWLIQSTRRFRKYDNTMNTNTLLTAGALALLLFWGMSRLFGGPTTEVSKRMQKVNGAEARELVKAGALVVDVRTPEEFSERHLDGAINIPVDAIESRLGELGESEQVLVYCRSGARSDRAARIIAESGKKVYDLGPMTAY